MPEQNKAERQEWFLSNAEDNLSEESFANFPIDTLPDARNNLEKFLFHGGDKGSPSFKKLKDLFDQRAVELNKRFSDSGWKKYDGTKL